MAETTVRQADLAMDFAMRKHRSLWGDAWRRLISLNTARLGMAIIGILLLVAAGDNVVRLLPPLVIGEAEVAEAIGCIDRAATRIEQSISATPKGAVA